MDLEEITRHVITVEVALYTIKLLGMMGSDLPEYSPNTRCGKVAIRTLVLPTPLDACYFAYEVIKIYLERRKNPPSAPNSETENYSTPNSSKTA